MQVLSKPTDQAGRAYVKQQVIELCRRFPIYAMTY
jgi:hypothetical protein